MRKHNTVAASLCRGFEAVAAATWLESPAAPSPALRRRLAETNFSCYKIEMAIKSANTEPEIVTRNGKPVSVILPIKQYQEMIERLEDAKDVAWLKRARRKKLHFRPLEDVLADLPQR